MNENSMIAAAPATMEQENRDFIEFLISSEASDSLAYAVDVAEEFGSFEGIIAELGTEEVAIDAYVQRIDALRDAFTDAQAPVENYIESRGYFDDMLAASRRVAEGDLGSWDALLTAAQYCQHSERKMPLELRRNLRKINVEGTTYGVADHHLRNAYTVHLRTERGATRGPLVTYGSINDDQFEVRGDTNPMLYVYRKTAGGYLEKCTQLGGMEPLDLAQQLLAELPGVMN